MVLTRRQLQEREQQQQQSAMTMEQAAAAPPTINGTVSTPTVSTTTTKGAHQSKTLQHQAMEIAAATKINQQQQQLNGQQRHQPLDKTSTTTTPRWVYVLLLVFAILTIVTIPQPFHPTITDGPSVRHVFYYGWLTAMSTGLGALPFLLSPDVGTYWVGISNAIAAGMMIAASYSLFTEGCTYDDPQDTSTVSAGVRTGLGALSGLIFIFATKNFLDRYEDLKMGGLGGTDARKALLIFFVMTLHSFSEGVGIGVSFGGLHGNELGLFISASLAVHNIPEGLAIAVVLLPRGVSILTASVWAIATSLPQPLMAVPAFWFVHYFIPILPVGLGFAGGAMAWVAFFELLMEAIEDTSLLTTVLVAVPSLLTMLLLQKMLGDSNNS